LKKTQKCPFCDGKMFYTGWQEITGMDWKCQTKSCIIYSHKDDVNEPEIF